MKLLHKGCKAVSMPFIQANQFNDFGNIRHLEFFLLSYTTINELLEKKQNKKKHSSTGLGGHPCSKLSAHISDINQSLFTVMLMYF